MKTSSISFIFSIITIIITVHLVRAQQTDSCSSNLNLNGLPFKTTSLQCLPVWNTQGFVLRYEKASPNLWSFVLSAPNPNSYVAMGFSSDGIMVGSSAIVGWISSDGTPLVKQYHLTGRSPSLVIPDQGNLMVANDSLRIISQASRLYLVFQLNIPTNQSPAPHVLYSFGPTGFLPTSPDYGLIEHTEKVSTSFNYVTGQSSSQSSHDGLRKSHGVLNMLSWGILLMIGVIVARHFKQWDPIWFYAHALIQTIGFLLGVTGVICGLILEDRLLNADVSSHKALGIIILVLGCLQVMAVLVRPDKTSKTRKYWNWYHHSVGRILILFSIANVFYGLHLGEAGNGWKAGFGIIMGILGLVSIFLEFQIWKRK